MILQLIISIGLINVWFFRVNKATDYRGGNAKNMQEEFLAYGLPIWSMYLVGTLKVAIAAPAKKIQKRFFFNPPTGL